MLATCHLHAICPNVIYSIVSTVLSGAFLWIHDGCLQNLTRNVSRSSMDHLFKFQCASRPSFVQNNTVKPGNLILKASLHDVLDIYGHWRAGQLRALARCHKVRIATRSTHSDMLGLLRMHNCSDSACDFEYVFEMLLTPRAPRAPSVVQPPQHVEVLQVRDASLERHNDSHEEIVEDPNGQDTDSSYLDIPDDDFRDEIIREWQTEMSTCRVQDKVCAVCGRCTPPKKIGLMKPQDINFGLLRNDALSDYVLPVSYNRTAYGGAILHPKGLTRLDDRGDLHVCKECAYDLKKRSPEMPRFALANWLYYGHERLPSQVKTAFSESTHIERLLISRARASRISFRFTELKGHNLEGTDWATSQGCVKGNVAIHPQDSTHLSNVLPPSNDAIRDMVCAVFVGDTKPTLENIARFRPVLVRKSRVKTMIEFLMEANHTYQSDGEFNGFSQANMDALFGEGTAGIYEGVPCAMQVGHLEMNDAVEGATDNYVPDSELGSTLDEMLMENVGFTDGDDTPYNYQEMGMKALAHCLKGGRFIASQAGSRLVPDFENPSLLSWLFPHLDPWGIGGFHEPRRTRKLSLEQQLKYLLMVDGSPFRNDPDFAFVYFNIQQKKSVFESIAFQVPASQRIRVVDRLLKTDTSKLEKLIAAYQRNRQYRPTDPDEVSIVQTMLKLTTVSHNVPGSNGYKMTLRNEIRGLINYLGTPTLFITLNPSDRDHPLVRLYAGQDISMEDYLPGEELKRWRRGVFAARNPAACARFFDIMISNFIQVILRYGCVKKGLFGKCKAYYGTVEAQGRGTLHCHMLVWLEGHPSPQKLRDNMNDSPEYKQRMFSWLEHIIKCELPGDVEVVKEQPGKPLRCPKRSEETGNPHPGVAPAPSRAAFSRREDFQAAFDAFVTDLLKAYNWHEHSSTCFKYVANGKVPKDPEERDALCRMSIDGSVRETTGVDEETGGILLRRLHPRIANYNDLVVFLMKCNMDIKHIGSGEGAKALVYYVTDYVTKPSLPVHVGLGVLSHAIQKSNEKFKDADENVRSRGALTLAVNRMLSSQETSHQQVMSYLVGGGDVYRSHTFRVLHWNAFDRMFQRHFKETITWEGDIIIETENAPGSNQDESIPSISDNIELREVGLVASDLIDISMHDENVAAAPNPDLELVSEESFTLKLSPGSISATNQQQDYVFRSNDVEFATLCLYDFVAGVEKIRGQGIELDGSADIEGTQLHTSEQANNNRRRRRGRPPTARGIFSSDEHTQYSTHCLRRRIQEIVPVVIGKRTPRADRELEEKALWARMMLILFVPWRSPSDLRDENETWLDAFERQKVQISARNLCVIDNMNVLSECHDVRDAHREARRSAVLKRIRGELPVSNIEHSGQIADNVGDDFQLFRNSTDGCLYENLNGSEAGGKALEAIIGSRTRELIDVCVSGSAAPGILQHAGNKASVLVRRQVEDDAPALGAHKAIMRGLKRQRRPEVRHDRGEDKENGPNRKPRKRQRVIENIKTSILGEGSHNRTSQGSNAVPHSPLELIDQVIDEMGLIENPEQLRAFRIVAEHVCNNHETREQLLMYIAGVGGTGKTHVVKSILRLFSLLGRSDEILIGAPTGAAALNIGGYTVHSLLHMPAEVSSKLTKELRELWRPVKYFIIDEISMIGGAFLAQASHRLQLAKGDEGESAMDPFGGINMIFTGDFGQLKPVLAVPLFSYSYIEKPGLQVNRSKKALEIMRGIYLWREVKTVVKLVKNQRQSGDLEYAALLNRVRVGEGRAYADVRTGAKSDLDILYSRIMSRVAAEDNTPLKEFRDVPYIVGSKFLRDAINARIIARTAADLGENVTEVRAVDKMEGKPVPEHLRQNLLNLPSSRTDDALGILPVFPGMKVMIRENIAFGKRLVNGTEGIVTEVIYNESEGGVHAAVAYVRVPGIGKITDDKPEDIVPIFPVSITFPCEFIVNGKSTPRYVSRTQLPLIPAYAYTDYKSQGKSLTHAIVDLESAKSLQGAYVMLSRVKSLTGLLILRPFSSAKLCSRLSEEIRNELQRIDDLDQLTSTTFEKQKSGEEFMEY